MANIKLANGESVLNSWDYAKVKTGGFLSKEVIEYNVTLTNKRFVALAESKKRIVREEVPLSRAKGISASAVSGGSLALWIKFFFCLFTIILIPVAIRVWKKINACEFGLLVLGDESLDAELIALGASNMKRNKVGFFGRLFGSLFKRKPKIFVDKQSAREIIDQVAAAIAEVQTKAE